MFQKAFVPFDKFFIELLQSNMKNNMKVQHYHDTYEIYLQISGERNLFLDDICHTLKRGDLVILRPFEIHYTESLDIDYYERFVMNFPIDKLSFMLSKNEINMLSNKLNSCVIQLNEEQIETVLGYFKMAEFYSVKKGFLAEKLLYSAVFQLIMMICESAEMAEAVTSQNIQPEIVAAIQYINKNYHENVDLDTLSEMVHMSKYHFCRLFHKATGATFLEYLYNVRLTKVHKMLLETDMPLNKIADKTGFSSLAHLTRIFRNVYNISPRDFRKAKTSDNEILNINEL